MYMRLACMPCVTTTGRCGAGPARRSMGRLRRLNVRPSILMLHARRRLDTGLLDGITLFYGMTRSTIVRSVSIPAVCRIPLMLRHRGVSRIVLHGIKLRIKPAPRVGP